MKKILIITLLFWTNMVHAINYYVDFTNGNDNATGTSAAQAWKTIARVNTAMAIMQPFDNIFFKRGEVWQTAVALTVTKPFITISSYGIGNKPQIHTLYTLTNWANLGNGIYEADAPLAANDLNLLLIDGQPQRIARFPNATASNGGYLSYVVQSSSSIKNASLSITPAVGTELVIKKNNYTIERTIVTAASGEIVSYRQGRGLNTGVTPITTPGQNGYGNFYQNAASYLDEYGEWWLDSVKKKIRVFIGSVNPSTIVVQYSASKRIINGGASNNLTVNGLQLDGADREAIFNKDGAGITITNCDFRNAGAKAISIWNTANVQIDNCTVQTALSNAIQVVNSTKRNVTITNCRVFNTAPFMGMSSWYDDMSNKAIYVTCQDTSLIAYNQVDTTAYNGIQFGGSNVTVINNSVNYYCYHLQDGGGIYTYTGSINSNPVNRRIAGNLITNGIGALAGSTESTRRVVGIYTDGYSPNLVIEYNAIINCTRNGVHSNNPLNVTVRNNLFYNNNYTLTNPTFRRGISYMKWAGGRLINYRATNNVVYNTQLTQYNVFHTVADLDSVPLQTYMQSSAGYVDSNYYNSTNLNTFMIEAYDSAMRVVRDTLRRVVVPVPFSAVNLTNWRSFTGFDANSVALPSYQADSIVWHINTGNQPLPIDLPGVVKTVDGSFVQGRIVLPPGRFFFGFLQAVSIPSQRKLLKAFRFP